MAHSTYYSRDSYYPDHDYHRPRSRRSSLSHPPTPASFHPPPIARSAIHYPATPFVHGSVAPPLPPNHGYPYSSYAGSLSNPHLDLLSRPRRASTAFYPSAPSQISDHPGGIIVWFKRKGAGRSGITLREALECESNHVILSGQNTYRLEDLGLGPWGGKIFVTVQLPGYPALNFEIPVNGYGGLVDLHSLARRIGRGVRHYLWAHSISVFPDQVWIEYLEEIWEGRWHLKMWIG